jgi:hypothetical protein
MTARAALRAALADGYRQSWRLALLNTAIGVVLLATAAAAAYALPAVLLALAAGPLTAALGHCAVVVARTGDLAWADALEGLRANWRRGLALGAFCSATTGLGVLAIWFYSHRGLWLLVAFAAYLLAMVWLWQLVAWPLAAADPGRPLRDVLGAAGRQLLARPRSALALGAVLLALNLVGAVAVIPLLTLTLAYSFLAAAHFALPPTPREG